MNDASHRQPPPRTSVRCRRRLWPAAIACVLAVVPVAHGAGEVAARAPTAADCASLLHQFDVAASAHQHAAHAESARKSRDLGAGACSAGHYADGVHQLRHALHDIGVKPVKAVAVPAPR